MRTYRRRAVGFGLTVAEEAHIVDLHRLATQVDRADHLPGHGPRRLHGLLHQDEIIGGGAGDVALIGAQHHRAGGEGPAVQPEAAALFRSDHHGSHRPALHPARQRRRGHGICQVDIDRNVGGETQMRICRRAIVIVARTDQTTLREELRQVDQLVIAIDVDPLAVSR